MSSGFDRLGGALLALSLALTAGCGPTAGAVPAVPEDGPPSGRYLLMDSGGRAVTNEDFPDRFQLIAFGYTYCPDICPTTLAEVSVILKNLGPEAERVQPLFVTVDPERDTPDKLRTYVQYFHPRLIGLSGSPELVKRAAENFQVGYEKAAEPGVRPGDYAVDHTAGLFLLGPDGGYVRKFAYSMAPSEIAAVLAGYLAETAPRGPRGN